MIDITSWSDAIKSQTHSISGYEFGDFDKASNSIFVYRGDDVVGTIEPDLDNTGQFTVDWIDDSIPEEMILRADINVDAVISLRPKVTGSTTRLLKEVKSAIVFEELVILRVLRSMLKGKPAGKYLFIEPETSRRYADMGLMFLTDEDADTVVQAMCRSDIYFYPIEYEVQDV
jgi:hypothetical protein